MQADLDVFGIVRQGPADDAEMPAAFSRRRCLLRPNRYDVTDAQRRCAARHVHQGIPIRAFIGHHPFAAALCLPFAEQAVQGVEAGVEAYPIDLPAAGEFAFDGVAPGGFKAA